MFSTCACQVINASPAAYKQFQACFGTQRLLGPRVLVLQSFGIQIDLSLSMGELITLIPHESTFALVQYNL